MVDAQSTDIFKVAIPEGLEREGIGIVSTSETDIVILKSGDGYSAFDRLCPHVGGDMGEGLMFGKNIKCPVHGYIFDVKTGKCLNQLGYHLQTYEVQVDNAELILRPITPVGRTATPDMRATSPEI